MAKKKHRKPKAARNRTIAKKRAQQLKQSQECKRRKRFARLPVLKADRPASTDFSRQTTKKSGQILSPVCHWPVCRARHRQAQAGALKQAGYTERQAAQQASEKFQISLSSIRRWEKLYLKRGFQALMDESRRPHTINFQISFEVKLLVVVIRTLQGRRFTSIARIGWGERRISHRPSVVDQEGAEIERREIACLCRACLPLLPACANGRQA